MKRRAAAPDRFYLEDPSFDRQIQLAIGLPQRSLRDFHRHGRGKSGSCRGSRAD